MSIKVSRDQEGPVLPMRGVQVFKPPGTGAAGKTSATGLPELPPYNLRSQKNTIH